MCSNSFLPLLSSYDDGHPTLSADDQPVQEIKAEEITVTSSSDRGSTIKEVDQKNSGVHYDSTVRSSSSSNMQHATVDQRVSSAHYSRGVTVTDPMGCFDIPPKYGGKIIQPSKNDVLNGRGGAVHSHPGNVTYRKIVNSYRAIYLSPTVRKLEKMKIADKVVNQVRSMNGKFLVKEGDYWYEIGDAKARRKAGQAMRENGPSFRKILMNEHDEKQNRPQNRPQDQRQNQYHEPQVSTQPLQPLATHASYVPHQDVMDYSTQHASNVRIAQLLTQASQEIQRSQLHPINTDRINADRTNADRINIVDHTILDTYGIEGLLLLNKLRKR